MNEPAPLEPLDTLVEAALALVAGASDLADLEVVERDLTGKRGTLTLRHRTLGGLEPDERREAGRMLQEAKARVDDAVSNRRSQLQASERQQRLDADRLDLTEVIGGREPGRLHLVTQ
ncbi:MAG: phenylalanine--tRNA ligase subunit alpha, partial [Actinomycetota bacterium]|nr:phenylalanine--tRNA ligase subunit alpha [Actinomycetota bacterium]